MKIPQYQIPILGEFVDAIYCALPFLSIVTSFGVVALVYDRFFAGINWMNVYIFYFLCLVIVGIVLVLIYIFVLKSLWAFRSRQMMELLNRLEAIEQAVKGNDASTETRHTTQ